MIPDDYTLELYREDGTWIEQIMVSDNLDDINKYQDNHPAETGCYYSIWVIQYDNETGEEMCSFPLY